MKIGIVIPTYRRHPEHTPRLLKRALDSIFIQEYKNFKVFLIGDRYDDDDEFQRLVASYPSDRMFAENLPVAYERDILTSDTYAQWCFGGVSATNYGIAKALEEDIEYICHLDHADHWEPQHLSNFVSVIEKEHPAWMCSRSTYLGGTLPTQAFEGPYFSFLPAPGGLVHSSVCMNFVSIPLRYARSILPGPEPADLNMWKRAAAYITEHGLKSFLLNDRTCNHEEEFTHESADGTVRIHF